MLKDERRAQDTERKIFCEVLNGLSELKNDEDFPLRTVSTAARLCRAAARNAAPEQADSAPFIDGPVQGPAGQGGLDSEENRWSRRRAHCRPARCTARMRADVLLSRNEHQRDRSRSCHFRKCGKNAPRRRAERHRARRSRERDRRPVAARCIPSAFSAAFSVPRCGTDRARRADRRKARADHARERRKEGRSLRKGGGALRCPGRREKSRQVSAAAPPREAPP